MNVVRQEDLQAFRWLQNNTHKADTIMNNYYDAGIWIPAIAQRKITTYHTNPIDMDTIRRISHPAKYAYIGQRSLIRTEDVVRAYIAEHPESALLMYQNGNAQIYKLLP